ncbi:Vacuolar amino acid transporter 4 [Nakaseomyces bracarensis]|uniref:Vacuolar amino acid transporter 4 n=1 Tax=Nakaseomyces bracarensis TaxID=273131 RepID=A0ABR4NMS1_9SACH
MLTSTAIKMEPTLYPAKYKSGRIFIGTWSEIDDEKLSTLEETIIQDDNTTADSFDSSTINQTPGLFSNFSRTFNYLFTKGRSMDLLPSTCKRYFGYVLKSGEKVFTSTIEDDGNVNPIGFDLIYMYSHFAGQKMPEININHQKSDESQKFDENEGISNLKAYLLLLKSFVGTGVLLLPSAFHSGGLLFSTILFLFIGIYSFWCYYLLAVVKKKTNVSCFGEIGNVVYGSVMKATIVLSLVLSQLGFSSAGIIFVANNMKDGLEKLFHFKNIKYIYLMLFQLVLYLPFGLITDITKFSLATMISNVLILSGLGIVFTLCCITLSNKNPTEIFRHINLGFNPNGWSFFVGTAIFAFEGIGLIIPVQDSMRTPEKFPLILALVILSSGLLFISIAIIGYLAFGDEVETIILQSLTTGGCMVSLLQLIYSIAIMIATPLQNLPIVNLLEDLLFTNSCHSQGQPHEDTNNELIDKPEVLPVVYLLGSISGSVHCFIVIIQNKFEQIFSIPKLNKNMILTLKISLRISITLFVVFLAYFGAEHLQKFVALIGSLFCIPLVYMIPPALHLRMCSIPKDQESLLKPNVIVDCALIILGGVSMVFTTYLSIVS